MADSQNNQLDADIFVARLYQWNANGLALAIETDAMVKVASLEADQPEFEANQGTDWEANRDAALALYRRQVGYWTVPIVEAGLFSQPACTPRVHSLSCKPPKVRTQSLILLPEATAAADTPTLPTKVSHASVEPQKSTQTQPASIQATAPQASVEATALSNMATPTAQADATTIITERPANDPATVSATAELTATVTPEATLAPNEPAATQNATIEPAARRVPLAQEPKLTTLLPEGMALRDRLTSLLQPPVSVLLGDQKMWVPFEPFPHQYEGIQFLFHRYAAILADEMGLGKTMQTIMAIRLLLRCGLVRRVLLVCPKPLMTNWQREFATWAEEVPITVVQGDLGARRNFWIYDQSPVKLINYETLTRDGDIFKEPGVEFELVVIDEAQRTKNSDSKTAQVVRSLRRQRSWALTGTPVENRAEDLISILDFIHQRQHSHELTTNDLKEAVVQVLLRRTKDVVMKDMPPRIIEDVYIDLETVQREHYELAEQNGVVRLNEMGEEATIDHVFELIRRLKQICNFDPVTGESAKVNQLRQHLEEAAANNQKAILFSQYVSTLELLSERLASFRPLLYHGGVAHKQRDQILDQFKRDPHRNLLMMSYATGAVGLNLQFSNYVFLFDRWWNPAIEDQAINRAHRLGQKETVFVFRYVTPNTIEERIAKVLENKRQLFNYLIDDPNATTAPEPLPLTQQEIFGLFDLKVR